MSGSLPQDERELAFILEGIAKTIAALPAEAVLAECRDEGLDVEAIARKAKGTLATAVKRHKQHKLVQARKEYEVRVLAMRGKGHPLPQSLDEKRDLLTKILSFKPEFQGAITVAARDFRDLSEDDIDLALKQLRDLGALDDLPMREDAR